MKKYFILSFMLFSMGGVAAEDQWSGNVKVLEIYTGYKQGFFLFRTTGTALNPASCKQSGLNSVETSNADVESVLSLLLSAKMSDKEVKIAVDGDRCGTSGIEHLSDKPSVSRVVIL